MLPDLVLSRALELPGECAVPIIKWAGGKRSLRRKLLALAPARISTFYEPFLGGATFYLTLASIHLVPHAVLSDANCELAYLYQAIRDDPQAVMEELDNLQQHVLDEEFYYRIRAAVPESLPLEKRAARFIYLNKTCYNGLYRVNSRGQFNVPFGRYPNPPGLYNRDNLFHVAYLLGQADLKCGDFEEALQNAGPEDFVYMDPPYAPLTATASFTRYTRGAFSDDDQRRLARTVDELTARGCKVLLSNSETPLVRDLYSGRDYYIDVVYAPRNINSDATGRQKIPELAIRNYNLSERGETGCQGERQHRGRAQA